MARTSWIERYFSDADREAIRAATARAEARTGGELVCYIVERCDTYTGAVLRTALHGALIASLAAALLHGILGLWGLALLWIALPPALGALLGWILVRAFPALHRWMLSRDSVDRQVERRAASAFLEEEIFATRGRTGVLLFLTLFEHRVLIVTDKGWLERSDGDAWQAIGDRLADGLRQGDGARALIEAVEACGEHMASVMPRPEADSNELSNEPRFRHDP